MPTAQEIRRVHGLVGQPLPPVSLEQVNGSIPTHSQGCAWIAYYFYPHRAEDPYGGGIPLHRAFRDAQGKLVAAGIAIVGVSSEPLHAQIATIVANRITCPMLNDARLLMADKLGLPTFDRDGTRDYQHLTLVTADAVIRKVFYPMTDPSAAPRQIMAWHRLNT